MTKEEIIEKYPSICYSCNNAWNPASNENREKGYVGCRMRLIGGVNISVSYDWEEIKKAKEIAEGWIDRSGIFNEKCGHIINFQLLTKEVKSCNKFDENKTKGYNNERFE